MGHKPVIFCIILAGFFGISASSYGGGLPWKRPSDEQKPLDTTRFFEGIGNPSFKEEMGPVKKTLLRLTTFSEESRKRAANAATAIRQQAEDARLQFGISYRRALVRASFGPRSAMFFINMKSSIRGLSFNGVYREIGSLVAAYQNKAQEFAKPYVRAGKSILRPIFDRTNRTKGVKGVKAKVGKKFRRLESRLQTIIEKAKFHFKRTLPQLPKFEIVPTQGGSPSAP